jgi:hypothetical protein
MQFGQWWCGGERSRARWSGRRQCWLGFPPPVSAQRRRGGQKWRGSGRVLHFKLARARHGGCEHGARHPRVEHGLLAVGGDESLNPSFSLHCRVTADFDHPISPKLARFRSWRYW